MLLLEVKDTGDYYKEVTFLAKCGHEQHFKYTAPVICRNKECNERLPSVEKLVGKINQDERVKYFVECWI